MIDATSTSFLQEKLTIPVQNGKELKAANTRNINIFYFFVTNGAIFIDRLRY